jgi:hypothetical protein
MIHRAAIIGIIALGISGALLVKYLERPRVVEGTWLYVFEGSDFFEGPPQENPCTLYSKSPAWLNYEPEKIYPSYSYKKSYPSAGSYTSEFGQWRMEAFRVKFAGRKRLSLIGTGHLGGWMSEFEVAKLISVKPIPNVNCRVS